MVLGVPPVPRPPNPLRLPATVAVKARRWFRSSLVLACPAALPERNITDPVALNFDPPPNHAS